MSKALPVLDNLDTIPEITETPLDGDPVAYFLVYVTGTGWRKISETNLADMVAALNA